MPIRHSLLAVGVMVVWGGNFVAIERGLQDVPPLLFLAIRFALVAFPLVLVVPRPAGRFRDVLAIGVFMSLGQFSLLYLALALGLPTGLASLLLQAQVIFTIALSAVVLRERPSRRQVAGVGLGATGLTLVAGAHGASASVLPVVVILAAALSWATGNVIARRSGITGGLSVVVWSALVVPLPALGLSLLVEGPAEMSRALAGFSTTAVVSTLYTVVGASLVGYAIWNGLLARYPAGAVVPFVLLVPPVGLSAGWLILGERPGATELLGAVVMLAGVALATVRIRWRRPEEAVTETVAGGCPERPALLGAR